MPKKTAYSRSGAQRNKTKQKSFELVRPVSDENVLDTVESSEVEEEEREDEDGEGTSSTAVEVEESEDEVVEVREVKAKAGKGAGTRMTPAAAAVASVPAETANGSPKSAAARMAARRQAAQRAQRSSSNLITVEHYNYVRKDLIFILILAIIMFGTIVVLHFVLGG
ncbi:MAG TPA: hypothetical protein VN729_03785 [Ktedonobacteraceae bacterium]|nr:hypothetical protein [Ktedonobacteraceae bacterium]